jgi:hypothetical protein
MKSVEVLAVPKKALANRKSVEILHIISKSNPQQGKKGQLNYTIT